MKKREIELGGAKWILSPISLNDMIAIEDNDLDPDSLKAARYMLYLSLLKSHPQVTEEKAGDLMTAENMGEVTDLLVGSLSKTKGEATKGKARRRTAKAKR